ncbi:MAG: excisionase, partial [Clostridia bacterium]|nr:excisionase [Clostridia bacterium]
MFYTLMHKDIPAVDFEWDTESCFIRQIGKVYSAAHLPVGISAVNNESIRFGLNDWWLSRAIPANRFGIRKALETLSVPNTKLLLTRCMGLSLSDQYWIRPQDSTVTWHEVNFFENSFSDDIGDVLLGKATKADGFDFHSPDNTSDGCLKKRWKIIDGRRCLIKAGSGPYMQQPFNEVIATKIMERLGIP